jgi:hypothetical protein
MREDRPCWENATNSAELQAVGADRLLVGGVGRGRIKVTAAVSMTKRDPVTVEAIETEEKERLVASRGTRMAEASMMMTIAQRARATKTGKLEETLVEGIVPLRKLSLIARPQRLWRIVGRAGVQVKKVQRRVRRVGVLLLTAAIEQHGKMMVELVLEKAEGAAKAEYRIRKQRGGIEREKKIGFGTRRKIWNEQWKGTEREKEKGKGRKREKRNEKERKKDRKKKTEHLKKKRKEKS